MKKVHQVLNFIVPAIITLMVIVIVSCLGDYYFDTGERLLFAKSEKLLS